MGFHACISANMYVRGCVYKRVDGVWSWRRGLCWCVGVSVRVCLRMCVSMGACTCVNTGGTAVAGSLDTNVDRNAPRIARVRGRQHVGTTTLAGVAAQGRQPFERSCTFVVTDASIGAAASFFCANTLEYHAWLLAGEPPMRCLEGSCAQSQGLGMVVVVV